MSDIKRITPREEDYSQWYLDIVREGDLAEPARVVKGCMVIKPHGYAIWEKTRDALDRMFKDTGHQNAYFPLFIPMSFLKKEARHVEGFSPELAVVTHGGGEELEEPYVVRPTSETIIGHFFAKWIRSHADLPLLINQWANVVRWELRTRMFLRTTEFLWQEGHTAHSTHEDAYAETERMLDIYATFAEKWMAMPVFRTVKTESEKFAGAETSMSIEAMMQDGKALQAGTSHDLGQNFGRAFDVTFQNEKGESEYVWQTSWGVSTRLIGGLIMTHSDDNGLVLPPKLAPVQVVLVPIYRKEKERAAVLEKCTAIHDALKKSGVSIRLDDRPGKRPGDKFYEWERKGVPVRLELGPRDMEKGHVSAKQRTEGERIFIKMDQIETEVPRLLEAFQEHLYSRALKFREENTLHVDTWDDFRNVFADGKSKFVWAHWDGTAATEAAIKEETKATIRGIPMPGHGPEPEPGKCIKTGAESGRRVLFAKAY